MNPIKNIIAIFLLIVPPALGNPQTSDVDFGSVIYSPEEKVTEQIPTPKEVSPLTEMEISAFIPQTLSHAQEEENLFQVLEEGNVDILHIIGKDNRKWVENTEVWPHSATGYIESFYPKGAKEACTGAMVGPHHVLTAGHCFHIKAEGGWANKVVYHPAAGYVFHAPFGGSKVCQYITYNGWSDKQDFQYDIGVLLLEEDIGQKTGWYGTNVLSDNDLLNRAVQITGYPGDKPAATQWTGGDIISEVTQTLIFHKADVVYGQSGSGMQIKGNYLVGVVTFQEITPWWNVWRHFNNWIWGKRNGGVRINSTVFNTIKNDWLTRKCPPKKMDELKNLEKGT